MVSGRRSFLLLMLALVALTLVWRIVNLQVFNKDFLQTEGRARSVRVASVPAHRGMIVDRNGEPLAISTPVDSVWANPSTMSASSVKVPALAHLLGLEPARLEQQLRSHAEREFIYLKRRIDPNVAQQVIALGIPGIALQREYRRYYPDGEVTSHVLGFTGIDDGGQEGLELAYDDWLRGIPGAKRVIKDRLGNTIEEIESLRSARPGRDLRISLDRRIQYLAHRELKAAIVEHQARSGSAVILDARSGEVLAMVNLPTYNPNKSEEPAADHYRNRAVTDVFEPGSTVKPFTIAAALESGRYTPTTAIDTTPGTFRVGQKLIRDTHNYGLIDVSTVIQKSSNIGASKISLSLPPQRLWDKFSGAGFGKSTASGFPGEVSGSLPGWQRWHELERCTLSFGYGLSVTALQLAHAYTALASDGRLRPVSFVRSDAHAEGARVMRAQTARQLRVMLERVVNEGGTGTLARVPGYRVAGKTGTVHKLGPQGYLADRYLSLFVGMAPASDPRLVMAVIINEPNGKEYYGGLVAAPVFSRVMAESLRLLGVAPDDLNHVPAHPETPVPVRNITSIASLANGYAP